MYAVLVVKPVYVRDYRFKSHVYHFSHVFRDGQENIKGKKWSVAPSSELLLLLLRWWKIGQRWVLSSENSLVVS